MNKPVVSALGHCARLQLTCVTLKGGQYQQLVDQLHWRVRATKLNDNSRNVQEQFNATDASPLFVVSPGIYEVEVIHDELGDKTISNVVLKADTLTDEVVYLGHVDIDDQEENYHLNDQEDFNVHAEHGRRQMDRDDQAKFGLAANGLRAPEIIGPDAGFGQAQQVAAQSGMQAHPLLSNSAQFDGVAAKMNPDLTNNVHAAEAQVSPELRPGAQPTPGPSTAPTLRRG